MNAIIGGLLPSVVVVGAGFAVLYGFYRALVGPAFAAEESARKEAARRSASQMPFAQPLPAAPCVYTSSLAGLAFRYDAEAHDTIANRGR